MPEYTARRDRSGRASTGSRYSLTKAGLALRPARIELVRWDLRFMDASRPEDHFDPRWLPVGCKTESAAQRAEGERSGVARALPGQGPQGQEKLAKMRCYLRSQQRVS